MNLAAIGENLAAIGEQLQWQGRLVYLWDPREHPVLLLIHCGFGVSPDIASGATSLTADINNLQGTYPIEASASGETGLVRPISRTEEFVLFCEFDVCLGNLRYRLGRNLRGH